jgi:hypothetical protein
VLEVKWEVCESNVVRRRGIIGEIKEGNKEIRCWPKIC